MRLRVNGTLREVPEGMRLGELLALLELDPGRIAVERNRELVRKQAFPTLVLEEADELEVVTLVGGG